GLSRLGRATAAIGTDYNNDRAVDIVFAAKPFPIAFRNPREGTFEAEHYFQEAQENENGPQAVTDRVRGGQGLAVLDYDHDGWMDVAFTYQSAAASILWRNNHGKSFEQVKLPETNWAHAYGVAALDYDDDGWVDLVAVGETKEGKGEIRLANCDEVHPTIVVVKIGRAHV